MAVTSERKQAVLKSMLDTLSSHLTLLMVGDQEMKRLNALQLELEETKAYLDGFLQATNTRVSR